MNQFVACLTWPLWLAGVSLAGPPQYAYGPYNEGRMDPQVEGWPLTVEERAYVVERAEHERRPGRESLKHLPQLWPVVPSAGHWGGTSWLETHEKLLRHVQTSAGRCDVLLVGDSITQQWGSVLDRGSLNSAWREVFGELRVINIGIGGDKTQNVLWRLDHGGVVGLQPRVSVLMIGNNNMFFVPETGVEAVAAGVQACVKNLRGKFPDAAIVVAKILPAHAPGHRFYEDIVRTNAALEQLGLEEDRALRVVDLWSDFTGADGQLRGELYAGDRIHLSEAGYGVYARRLQPLVTAVLRGEPLPK
ncbi:MAG: GDSL-type esterase/lipase family protein [Planctomyces sp.]